MYIKYFVAADITLPMDSTIDNNEILVGSISGTMYAQPTLVAGKRGNALYFNGVDQWVNFGDQRNTCFGNLEQCPDGYSLIHWIKLGTKSAIGKTLFYYSNGGQTSSSHGITLFRKGNILGTTFSTRSMEWKGYDLMEVSDEVWYHIGFTWHPDTGVTFFLNGCQTEPLQPFNVKSRSLASTPHNDFTLGTPNNQLNVNGMMGEFYVDELEIFYRDLHPADIWKRFHSF